LGHLFCRFIKTCAASLHYDPDANLNDDFFRETCFRPYSWIKEINLHSSFSAP